MLCGLFNNEKKKNGIVDVHNALINVYDSNMEYIEK